MRKKSEIIIVVLVILVSVFLVHIYSTNLPGVDSFYHIRHSQIYQSTTFLDSSFPWTTYSMVREIGADLWYGFHVLISPLTYFDNLITGIRVGAFFVTTALLLLVYAAIKRFGFRWPLLWVFLFWLATPDLLYRSTTLRPHPLSLGLILLIFAFLVKKKDERPYLRYLILLLAGFLFSWIHISLIWVPILTALLIILVEFGRKRPVPWKGFGAMFVGLMIGVFLRPNPLGALKLAKIQVLDLIPQNYGDIYIRFGSELIPFKMFHFWDQILPIFILLAASTLTLIWLKRSGYINTGNQTTLIITSFVMMIVFFILSFTFARRANEIFVGFATIYLALGYSQLTLAGKLRINTLGKKIFAFVIIATLLYMPVKTLFRYSKFTENAFPPEEFKEAGLWFAENARPDEIVFHPHWDRFSRLFFWAPNTKYLNGMDPIFMFALDESLYWKTHFYLINQGGATTCGMVRCNAREVEDTYTVLTRDFKASYVFVEPQRSSKLYSYLNTDSRFEKVFGNTTEVIYRIR